MKKILIAASLVAFTLITNAQSAKIALKPDTKITTEAKSEVEVTISAMGQEMEVKNNMQSFKKYDVKKAENGGVEMDMTVTRVVAKINAPGQDVDFDSDKDKDGDAAESLSKRVGKTQTIVIDKDGKQTNEVKNDKDEEAAGMMSAMSTIMGNIMGLDLFDAYLLNRDFKVGDTWTGNTSTDKSTIKSKTETKYTVASIEKNIATVTTVTTTSLSGTIDQMGTEMEVKGTNSATGTIKLDLNTGVIIETDETISINTTMSVQGMEIPMTGKRIAKTKAVIN